MLNVAIIGLGNISLLFDTSKDTTQALSHIKAIFLHKKFKLKYIVDIDNTNEKFAKSFFPDVIFFKNYEELLEKNDIDVLVISTPTNTHFEILDKFSKNISIKLFFMEKPLFNTIDEYKKLDKSITNKIVVNYLRRFDKNIQELKENITNNTLKNPQKIIVNYCKGIKNNGTHMIDLVNFLFSNPKILSSKILNISSGFNKDDSNYDLYINVEYKSKNIPIYFISHNHNKYNIITCDIFFENMQVAYNNSKSTIEYKKIVNDKNFPTYKVFEHSAKIVDVDTLFMMYNAYNNIYNIIKNNSRNVSSYKDELQNVEFLKTIKEEE